MLILEDFKVEVHQSNVLVKAQQVGWENEPEAKEAFRHFRIHGRADLKSFIDEEKVSNSQTASFRHIDYSHSNPLIEELIISVYLALREGRTGQRCFGNWY